MRLKSRKSLKELVLDICVKECMNVHAESLVGLGRTNPPFLRILGGVENARGFGRWEDDGVPNIVIDDVGPRMQQGMKISNNVFMQVAGMECHLIRVVVHMRGNMERVQVGTWFKRGLENKSSGAFNLAPRSLGKRKRVSLTNAMETERKLNFRSGQ